MITMSRYQVGEVIVQENELGETAYVIEDGQVEVTKELDGKRARLAIMGAGETFGEMSMIDDKPRSATVTAIAETVVREIHRDEFFQSLQTNPGVALNLLKVLFERLRESHAAVLRGVGSSLQEHQDFGSPQALVPSVLPPEGAPQTDTVISLEGLTPRAIQALPTNPFKITKFPFRVGRESPDPLVYNDLMLPDSVPLQISRHHLGFLKYEDRIGVMDRGSQLGSLVDDQQLGGPDGPPGPLFFTGSEGILVLGNRYSPYRYRVVIRTEG